MQFRNAQSWRWRGSGSNCQPPETLKFLLIYTVCMWRTRQIKSPRSYFSFFFIDKHKNVKQFKIRSYSWLWTQYQNTFSAESGSNKVQILLLSRSGFCSLGISTSLLFSTVFPNCLYFHLLTLVNPSALVLKTDWLFDPLFWIIFIIKSKIFFFSFFYCISELSYCYLSKSLFFWDLSIHTIT